MSKIRAIQVVRLDAGLFAGGGEVQAEMTAKALPRHGVDISPYRPEIAPTADILHFYGNFDYYEEIATHARKLGIPYVVSPIFATSRTEGRLRWRSTRQRLLGRYRDASKRLLAGAQRLITLSGREERLLRAYYGNGLPPMIMIPNGVDDRFARGNPAKFADRTGVAAKFALMVGSITPGKNQLPVITACGDDIPLVVIGPEHHHTYVQTCKRHAGKQTRFLGPFSHEDSMVADAMAAAHVFVHPSLHELFPLAPLEAAVAGARLLLADRWGSRDIFGDTATYCAGAWREDILSSMHSERPGTHQSEAFLRKFSWDSVGEQVATVYRQVLER